MIPMPIIDSGHTVVLNACGLRYTWRREHEDAGVFQIYADDVRIASLGMKRDKALERMHAARDAHHVFLQRHAKDA